MLYKNRNIFKSKGIVCFDTNQLVSYLTDENSNEKWFGISFQLQNCKIESSSNAIYFEKAFNILISNKKGINTWYVQPYHPIKLFPWLSDTDDCTEISNLKKVLDKDDNFKGYISLETEELKTMFKDFFLYSFITNSQDLMIFNSNEPFIILFNQHLSFDIISQDENIISNSIELFKNFNYSAKRYL